MKKFTRFFSVVLMVLFFGISLASAEDEGSGYVVVVNKDVPASSVTLKMLKRIYLKDMTNWEGGGAIVPIDLDEENSLRASFSKKVLGKGTDEMKAYWINQKLTNNLSPPIALKNSQNVKKYVSQNSGAIGYIKQSEADSTVKILQVEP